MDASTTVIKLNRTPSPGKTNKSTKIAMDCATLTYACVTASTPPHSAESAGPPPVSSPSKLGGMWGIGGLREAGKFE
ncbi:hypothetical protein E2C01_083494 [Portunus trituberculatus]|uniref:Uncharacterized protein n=1 Tax=Portunus trituberculatus TaxID=210409 RepID=A0A5B7IVB7_PORTR|nr:hypothetical protein [Portunus trituberculatus]